MNILKLLRERNFEDFKGARVSIRVPLRRGVLNRFLAAAKMPKLIKKVEIVSIEGLEIAIRITLNLFSIDHTIRLALSDRPTRGLIVLELLQEHVGLLAKLFSGKLPEGMELNGKVLTIYLGRFLEQNEQTAAFSSWIHELQFQGGRDELFLTLGLQH